LVKDLVANDVPTFKYPPLSPDDFHLLPRLKSTLKVHSFCGTTDTTQNAMDELKRLSQNVFQECFQHLYSRWQEYILAQGEYSEGNVA
jgi:hypothetical protein